VKSHRTASTKGFLMSLPKDSSLLIFEPRWWGHHMRYASWIAQEAVARGYDVWLASTTRCFEQPLYLRLQEKCGRRIRPLALPEELGSLEPHGLLGTARFQFRHYGMFARCYRRLSREDQPDFVFIPYLDYCAYAVSLLGSPFGRTPWGGIMTEALFHLEEMGVRVPSSRIRWIGRRLFFRMLRTRSLRAMFTFDETLVHYVRQKHPDLAGSLRYLPEPTELQGSHSRESARQFLGIPSDATVILVYGALDASKGIDALLESTRVDGFPEEVSLLAAGLQEPEVKALLASPQARAMREAGRLYEYDAFLYGEDEQAVFCASDVVWLGYRGQYVASGVQLQAALAGLPIVACEEELIGWLTRTHGLGLTVAIDDARMVAEAISRLVRDRELSTECAENAKRFVLPHKVDRFRQTIGKELLLNFPPQEPRKSRSRIPSAANALHRLQRVLGEVRGTSNSDDRVKPMGKAPPP
jgi:glycosyltransferase involved in cell wall biosynthesis